MMRWLISLCSLIVINGFVTQPGSQSSADESRMKPVLHLDRPSGADPLSRRDLLVGAGAAAVFTNAPPAADASVGSLPEFASTNVILQGLTVKVADAQQRDQMLSFLQNAFDFQILRATNDDTWLGYGPEQVSIPDGFAVPSSFSKYGGHASVRVQYDSQATSAYYRGGGDAPGDNVAYLQVGVPQYRVSQMVKNGGNVIDAYGLINVVSPSGLPMRGIVGIWPDPMMFVAINCGDVQNSKAFYQQLGFAEQEYPYCRPGKGTGEFEPMQPKNSVYMAPTPTSMGVLLLPTKKKIKPNPAFQSLNLVYSPSDNAEEVSKVEDPSGLVVSFDTASKFSAAERATRVSRK